MSKNITVDGRTLEGVTAIKVKSANSEQYFSFADTSDANATAIDIAAGKTAYVNGSKITGTNTGTEPNDLDGLVDGTLTRFVMPSGKTTIKQHRFYGFSSLTSANLGAVKTIEQYAFYNCTNIANFEMPNTVTNIGNYACYYLASNKQAFELAPVNKCTVGDNAFQYSKVSKVKGQFSVGSNSFRNCNSLNEIDAEFTALGTYAFSELASYLTKVHAKVNGSIGSYAFNGCRAVNDFQLDPNSVITSMSDYAFSQFGGNRANPENNRFTFDFRKSTFTTLPSYCFGYSSSSASYKVKHADIYLPNTLATINSCAFRYADNLSIYLGRGKVALANVDAFGNTTNCTVFVPHNMVNSYRTAEKWNSIIAPIKGYATVDDFEVGDELPTIGQECYGMTWYSDKECTQEITEMPEDTDIIYCLVGTVQLAYPIKKVTTVGCSVVISDGIRIYTAGSVVPTGTTLTVTAIPEVEGYVSYMFTLNGNNVEDDETTYIMNADLTIVAMYYDGIHVPYNPNFAENSWAMIRSAFETGVALDLDWNVGDTKTVTASDGKVYTVRIADKTPGRYNKTEGGTTNGVLEFVERVSIGGSWTKAINSSPKENGYYAGGGWALCDMKNTHLPAFLATLEEEFQEALVDITLSEYSYTSPSPRTSTGNKLFLPAETEIFDARHYSAEGERTGCPKLTQFQYYATHNTNADRIKKNVGTTTTGSWWLRSPYNGDGDFFCYVYSGGSYNGSYASYSSGVSPCFAF